MYTKHTIFPAILGQQQHMLLNTRTTGKLKLKSQHVGKVHLIWQGGGEEDEDIETQSLKFLQPPLAGGSVFLGAPPPVGFEEYKFSEPPFCHIKWTFPRFFNLSFTCITSVEEHVLLLT